MPRKSQNNFAENAPIRGGGVNRTQTGGGRHVSRQPSFSSPAIDDRKHRARRGTLLAQFQIPKHKQGLVLNLPIVRRQMEWQRRVLILHSALALMATGKFSMRTASAALGISTSQICVWLKAYQERGADGLVPKYRYTTRPQGGETPQRFIPAGNQL
jgi:hypothetical protein